MQVVRGGRLVVVAQDAGAPEAPLAEVQGRRAIKIPVEAAPNAVDGAIHAGDFRVRWEVLGGADDPHVADECSLRGAVAGVVDPRD